MLAGPRCCRVDWSTARSACAAEEVASHRRTPTTTAGSSSPSSSLTSRPPRQSLLQKEVGNRGAMLSSRDRKRHVSVREANILPLLIDCSRGPPSSPVQLRTAVRTGDIRSTKPIAEVMAKRRRERLSLERMQEAARTLGGECLSTEYRNLFTPMRWRCALGHEWQAQGQNVRRGRWCLRCSGKMRGTIEEMRAIAESRGGRCLATTCKNMSTKLRWQCQHGHRWNARPHLVKLGRWCPKCANRRRSEKMRGNMNWKGARARF